MIKLHPQVDVQHCCPFDNTKLEAVDWYIPGMRNLAEVRCEECGREFYGDLLAGHGLYYPMLLNKQSGEVYDSHNVEWFADWLRNSYAHRSHERLEFVTEEFRSVRTPVLLNCLDRLYGHCVLKLLNVQYYLDHRPDLDLIVLVPSCLRWMVPDGVAAIWTVGLQLHRGSEWNDWLAAEIKIRLKQFDEVWLSVAYSHPHPKDFAIDRFTRVQPFRFDESDGRSMPPRAMFIWREDRLWTDQRIFARIGHLPTKLFAKMGVRSLSTSRREQTRRVVRLATDLRKAFPRLSFGVVGLGTPGGMPDWIEDLRTTAIDGKIEKDWCDRYAHSCVVIGIHGSNMLLPSAHAGATVELMPPGRWGNIVQDLLMRNLDCREALFRYRILPISTSIADLTAVVSSLLRDSWAMEINMAPESVNHCEMKNARLSQRRLELLQRRSKALS
jgi:hypothetical protein